MGRLTYRWIRWFGKHACIAYSGRGIDTDVDNSARNVNSYEVVTTDGACLRPLYKELYMNNRKSLCDLVTETAPLILITISDDFSIQLYSPNSFSKSRCVQVKYILFYSPVDLWKHQ